MSRVSHDLRAEIAAAVRNARTRAELSRARAAALCGVTPLIIHLVERGEAPCVEPYLPFMARILDFLPAASAEEAPSHAPDLRRA
jgi:ribosome-binding protein aMBF1 (putative translation factor)